MVDRDIVLEKVANIQNCLRRIADVTKGKPESLDDINIQDVFVLNLQRAIQSAIDLGSHIVASEGLGLPDKIKEIFIILGTKKIIDQKLSKKLMSMVGFRNIAVHDYSAIEPEALKEILANHLEDLEKFYESVLRHFKIVTR